MDQGNKKEWGEWFSKMFEDGRKFMEELMRSNELLRSDNARLESELSQIKNAHGDASQIEKLKTELLMVEKSKAGIEKELKELRNRLTKVEEENRYFADRYVEIERQNSSFASLYVASYQLHSTLDFNRVLRVINEIVINLIGTERFGLYLYDERSQELILASGEGVNERIGETIKLGFGKVGETAQKQVTYVSDYLPAEPENGEPVACVPLLVDGRLVGILAIFRLLVQKDGFETIDMELFELLAGHAATALLSAKIYSQSKRKLNTLQSFMELLNPAVQAKTSNRGIEVTVLNGKKDI